jgi:phosphonate degradation associated HDIG domain protein
MTRADLTEGDIVERLADIFARRGADAYLGERVTMAEHMLQTAALAAADGAPDTLVAAALLHDIGHFTSDLGSYAPDDAVDRRHEAAGAEALGGYFPAGVTESVRLHVAAKRYLCATGPTYAARLSEASQHTLSLQGGAMTVREVADFRRSPFHADAVRIRLWDDAGKVAGVRTPSFKDFLPFLRRVLTNH